MEEQKEEQQDNSVESVFKQGEDTVQQQIAIKAIGLVKPMLKDCCQQISNYLGDCEKVILINKTKKDSPVGILVLDTKGSFEIKGGDSFSFKGDKTALLKYYTAEEFVEMLLSGQLKELTEKLLS